MYCSISNLTTDLVTDGNKDIGKSAIFRGDCNPVSYIEVLLEASYVVHYVVVTEGEDVEGLEDALQLFLVELHNDDGAHEFCSMYIWSSKGAGKDMRVNCWARFANRVRIVSRKNVGLSIAEIEAYMLGSGGPGVRPHFYYGCLEHFNSRSSPLFTDWKSCLLECDDNQFAAIYNGSACNCGSIKHNALPIEPEHCNIICGNQFCGGHRYYSVYLLAINLPFYLGCIRGTSKDRTFAGDLSPLICINFCMNADDIMYVASMQGQSCICGQDLSVGHRAKLWGPDHEECPNTCDAYEAHCGGGIAWFNVYGLPNFPFALLKEEKFFLSSMLSTCEGDMDMYGVCRECKPGLEGSRYCYGKILDEKPDCDMFDPCAYMVDKICDDSKEVYDCICLPGYEFNDATMSCEDIDECNSGKELCPDKVSVCVNFNGSFHCSCLPGFVRLTGLICAPEDSKPGYSKLQIILISFFIFLLIALIVVGMYIWICGKMAHSTPESHDSASTGG